MDFLDIPGLNIAQESGGKGWNPANAVPFCTRADKWRVGQKVNFDPGWSKVRFGRQSLGGSPPTPPMRSGYIDHFFFAFRAILNRKGEPMRETRFSFLPLRGSLRLAGATDLGDTRGLRPALDAMSRAAASAHVALAAELGSSRHRR